MKIQKKARTMDENTQEVIIELGHLRDAANSACDAYRRASGKQRAATRLAMETAQDAYRTRLFSYANGDQEKYNRTMDTLLGVG